MPTNDYAIRATIDPQLFAQCARMMSQSDPWITLGISYDQCLQAFEGPGKEIYVVDSGTEISAFVVLQVTGTFKGYIQTICVQEKSRGNGIGKILLTFCEERILKISPNIFICVSSFNTGAIRLYKKSGYVEVGKLENFVKQNFTELLLRKTHGPLIN